MNCIKNYLKKQLYFRSYYLRKELDNQLRLEWINREARIYIEKHYSFFTPETKEKMIIAYYEGMKNALNNQFETCMPF